METELTFGEWLEDTLLRKGFTQVALAELIGVTQPTVSGWVNGAIPSKRVRPELAAALEMSVESLNHRIERSVTRNRREIREAVVPLYNINRKSAGDESRGTMTLVPIPILGIVPANFARWATAVQGHAWVPVAITDALSNAAVVIVSGDCLVERGIISGDYAIIDQEARPLRTGQIVVVRVADEVTMKEWHPQPDGSVELRASSDRYPVIRIDRDQEDVEIIGVYRGLYRVER
jgi:SOS-response transcriptional repressor LexA